MREWRVNAGNLHRFAVTNTPMWYVKDEDVEALLKRFAAFPPEVFRKAQEAIGR